MSQPKDLDNLICVACGTQFDETTKDDKTACKICDDPRQFVLRSGQAFTTLRALPKDHENEFLQDENDSRVWTIRTEPKFAIGQRAFLLRTKSGNILWDCISLLDQATISKVQALGGLKAIIISHPHFYTTYTEWARAFNCPVYTSIEDKQWLHRQDVAGVERQFIAAPTELITPDVTAVKAGGHFDGSLVLHWEKMLYVADTLVTVPSAYYHVDRPPGTTSYSFMWSIPNMIPLPPDKIAAIWNAIKGYDFEATHGGFAGTDVRDVNVKKRVLESARIQIKAEGYHGYVLEE